jgi:DNA-directed RNA polymerase alpha subunit
VVALRTYQSIAEEMDLSRQRIKQIVVAVSQHIQWMQSVDEPRKMCDLVLPRRIRNCLKNEGLFDLTFEEFIDYSKKKNLGDIPNLGKGSLELLELKLTEATNGH